MSTFQIFPVCIFQPIRMKFCKMMTPSAVCVLHFRTLRRIERDMFFFLFSPMIRAGDCFVILGNFQEGNQFSPERKSREEKEAMLIMDLL